MSDAFKEIVLAQKAVSKAERTVTAEKRQLTRIVRYFLEQRPGSLRDKAKTLGFSAPYLSDVMNGNRPVSGEFIERLRRLA